MRFVVTGEWSRNRLLQVIVLVYCVYVVLLWVTNALLYFEKMSLSPASVVRYYLGSDAEFLGPRSYAGMLEVSHFHLFAMGMLLLVLTHLVLFIPARGAMKAWLIALPFAAALLDEGSGWLVRFVHPAFAWAKVIGFLSLQASLAALVVVSLWAVLRGSSENYVGIDEADDEDDAVGPGAP